MPDGLAASEHSVSTQGLVYHSRDFPRYLIGKGLVGEIRGGHPEILSRLLIRDCSDSVVECLTRDWRDCRFEPHGRHCVVSLVQETFMLRLA